MVVENQNDVMAAAYDDEAEASGWFGPEVAFGLACAYVQPGQSIQDIGIGAGLGSVLFRKAGLNVYGMDISPKMLDACRSKGFTALQLHDLGKPPYPYDSESMDHAVCTGVLNFLSDLSPVFKETARILRKGGLLAFVVGDRVEGEAHEVKVGPEHTKSERTVMMYRHSPEQIDTWLQRYGFELVRSLAFTIFMDRARTRSMPARAYPARIRVGSEVRLQLTPRITRMGDDTHTALRLYCKCTRQ
ncbi:MAG: class I SAM-dependent methyltransferase [Anaerolineae bacterium]|jgi:predicted TPR repeat methyltransferase